MNATAEEKQELAERVDRLAASIPERDDLHLAQEYLRDLASNLRGSALHGHSVLMHSDGLGRVYLG